jgi:hypothetical protein
LRGESLRASYPPGEDYGGTKQALIQAIKNAFIYNRKFTFLVNFLYIIDINFPAIKSHYVRKYGMLDAGWQMFLEGQALNDIILKYLL